MTEITKPAKAAWRKPEIHDVGNIVDVTDVGVENVRDNTNDMLRTYKDKAIQDPREEVELDR